MHQGSKTLGLYNHGLTILTKKELNLQMDQSLQKAPSLLVDQVGQPYLALQMDQWGQYLHGHHEVHPYQRYQRGQGVQQYPERVGLSVSVCEREGCANVYVLH